MFSSWFKKRPTDAPLDEASLRETLEANVWQYRFLDAEGRARVTQVVQRLASDKEWTGGSGFQVTHEMRATISGVAALVTLGLDEPFFFPRLKTVILYPGAFSNRPKSGTNLFGESVDDGFAGSGRLGEAWQSGPIVLSWRHVLRNARHPGRGANVTLHELAHHLDGLDGMMDGVPSMPDSRSQRDWHAVTDAEFHRLVGQSKRGDATLLDTYGASSRAEFFAVSVECFFERPHELRERHAELYRLLCGYFHQSPTDWLPDLREEETPAVKPIRCRRRCRAGSTGAADYSELGFNEGDRRFTRGVELLERGLPVEAEAEFTAALQDAPDDAEALGYRAVARLQQGVDRRALADAEAALEIDPDDLNALLAAADAQIGLGDDTPATKRVRRALELDNRNGHAWLLRGVLHHRSGELRQAKRCLRKATGFEPYDAESHFWLGRVLEAMGDQQAAERSFARADQLDPETDFEAV